MVCSDYVTISLMVYEESIHKYCLYTTNNGRWWWTIIEDRQNQDRMAHFSKANKTEWCIYKTFLRHWALLDFRGLAGSAIFSKYVSAACNRAWATFSVSSKITLHTAMAVLQVQSNKLTLDIYWLFEVITATHGMCIQNLRGCLIGKH